MPLRSDRQVILQSHGKWTAWRAARDGFKSRGMKPAQAAAAADKEFAEFLEDMGNTPAVVDTVKEEKRLAASVLIQQRAEERRALSSLRSRLSCL